MTAVFGVQMNEEPGDKFEVSHRRGTLKGVPTVKSPKSRC